MQKQTGKIGLMKKTAGICGIVFLIFLLTIFSMKTGYMEEQKEEYVKAYTDFMLNYNPNEVDTFPISGYYLFDMNFDKIPELGVLHDSGGSMGGYFELYCFVKGEIVTILNANNGPAIISNYTQILADFENEKVYLLKEMYHLIGNENGTYGYVGKVINENGRPRITNYLSLEINQEISYEEIVSEYKYDSSYKFEDDFLSDIELDDCLSTKYYSDGKWNEISSKDYLNLKHQQIPEENIFKDLRETDSFLIIGDFSELLDENEKYVNMRITEEEIDLLLKKWSAVYD